MIIPRAQQPIPTGLSVSARTTPVVYFGDLKKSHVCTISINPSDREFYDTKGNLLSGNSARLVSRADLNKADSQSLTSNEAQQVVKDCDNYFNKRPYRLWFNKYDVLLNEFNLSYYQHPEMNRVVHLDLVQWATSPAWSRLSPQIQNSLIMHDLPFLQYLLGVHSGVACETNSKPFKTIFLNGSTVVNTVVAHIGMRLNSIPILFNGINCLCFHGYYGSSLVIGWSLYLQSSAVGGYLKIKKFTHLIIAELIKVYGLKTLKAHGLFV